MNSQEERDAIETPDLQRMGISQPPAEPPQLGQQPSANGPAPGLIDAMRGGIPPGLLSAMLPQPMSQGQVFASALAGGVSAMRGQANPVDEQYRQQVAYQQKAGDTTYKVMERAAAPAREDERASKGNGGRPFEE